MGVSKKKKVAEKPKKAIRSRSQFCITVVSSALQLGNLELPRKFVENHGEHLSNPVYLRVPSGRDCPVELLKQNANAKLHRGWSQFAERYSVASGYIVVFRYDGSSRFRVKVFDTTALEIEYSHIYTIRVPTVEETEKDDEQGNLSYPTEEVTGGRVKEDVIEKANAFVDGSPGFILPMNKTYVDSSTSVRVPFAHALQYLKDEGIDDGNVIVVNVQDGKTWKLKYKVYQSRPRLTPNTWIKFRMDNRLKIHNVCAFKMVDVARKVYDVAVF